MTYDYSRTHAHTHTLDLYATTVKQLLDLYAELAQVRADEVTNRADAYQSSGQSSPSGRESDARAAVAQITATAIALEGEIRASELTLRYLDQVLAHE